MLGKTKSNENKSVLADLQSSPGNWKFLGGKRHLPSKILCEKGEGGGNERATSESKMCFCRSRATCKEEQAASNRAEEEP